MIQFPKMLDYKLHMAEVRRWVDVFLFSSLFDDVPGK